MENKIVNDKKLSHPQVIVAIIGLIGILGTAFIAAWVTLGEESPTKELHSTVVQTQKYYLKAEIDDPDGYTNVRSLPSTDGQILDKIHAGDILYTHYQTGNWWHVKTPKNKVGYIHSSRIKLSE